jgi:flagellar hook-length control protein FliK
MLFKDISPTRLQGDQSLQGPENLVPSDDVQAMMVANLISGELKAPASDSKMQPGGGSVSVSEVSRVAEERNTQNAVAAMSEHSQSTAQSDIAPSSIAFPLSVPENLTAGKMPSAPVKPTSDRVSFAPARVAETAGTSGKTVESTVSVTSPARKDGSSSSLNSQATDQSNVAVPSKIIDTSSSFSLAGGQSLTGDGKNGAASASPRESDPLPTSHADQELSGAAAPATQAEIQATYPTSLINSAKLVERMGESELRLALRTGEFGNVDIRTSMVRNQFTAEISVERGDLGRVMAADLPSLQNRLTEQALPVANITLQNHSGGQPAAYEQQKPRDGQQTTNPGSGRDEAQGPILAAFEAPALPPMSGLDIHM